MKAVEAKTIDDTVRNNTFEEVRGPRSKSAEILIIRDPHDLELSILRTHAPSAQEQEGNAAFDDVFVTKFSYPGLLSDSNLVDAFESAFPLSLSSIHAEPHNYALQMHYALRQQLEKQGRVVSMSLYAIACMYDKPAAESLLANRIAGYFQVLACPDGAFIAYQRTEDGKKKHFEAYEQQATLGGWSRLWARLKGISTQELLDERKEKGTIAFGKEIFVEFDLAYVQERVEQYHSRIVPFQKLDEQRA